jgi:hypothetical protein
VSRVVWSRESGSAVCRVVFEMARIRVRTPLHRPLAVPSVVSCTHPVQPREDASAGVRARSVLVVSTHPEVASIRTLLDLPQVGTMTTHSRGGVRWRERMGPSWEGSRLEARAIRWTAASAWLSGWCGTIPTLLSSRSRLVVRSLPVVASRPSTQSIDRSQRLATRSGRPGTSTVDRSVSTQSDVPHQTCTEHENELLAPHVSSGRRSARDREDTLRHRLRFVCVCVCMNLSVNEIQRRDDEQNKRESDSQWTIGRARLTRHDSLRVAASRLAKRKVYSQMLRHKERSGVAALLLLQATSPRLEVRLLRESLGDHSSIVTIDLGEHLDHARLDLLTCAAE